MSLPWVGLFGVTAIFGLTTAAGGAILNPLALGCSWLALTILVDLGATGRAISSLRDSFRNAAARCPAPSDGHSRTAADRVDAFDWSRAAPQRRGFQRAPQRGALTDTSGSVAPQSAPCETRLHPSRRDGQTRAG